MSCCFKKGELLADRTKNCGFPPASVARRDVHNESCQTHDSIVHAVANAAWLNVQANNQAEGQ